MAAKSDGERDRHVRRSGDDYTHAFLALFPKGIGWPREFGSVFERTCNGLAQYWGFVDSRAADLLERETDPRKTTEVTSADGSRDGLLPEWERAWGLPDPCLGEPLNQEERRHVLVKWMTLLGAQSRQWFEEVASWVGYEIDALEFREYAPFMTGISRCGSTLDDSGYQRWEIASPEIRFYWSVRVDSARLTWFRVDASEVGVDPHLIIGLATDLECLLRRWKPAHTEIIFSYTGLYITGTSTSSVELGSGSKTFVTQGLLGFIPGTRARAASRTTPAAWLEGPITSYINDTIEIASDLTSGQVGTFDDWLIQSAEPNLGGSMAGTP